MRRRFSVNNLLAKKPSFLGKPQPRNGSHLPVVQRDSKPRAGWHPLVTPLSPTSTGAVHKPGVPAPFESDSPLTNTHVSNLQCLRFGYRSHAIHRPQVSLYYLKLSASVQNTQ